MFDIHTTQLVRDNYRKKTNRQHKQKINKTQQKNPRFRGFFNSVARPNVAVYCVQHPSDLPIPAVLI